MKLCYGQQTKNLISIAIWRKRRRLEQWFKNYTIKWLTVKFVIMFLWPWCLCFFYHLYYVDSWIFLYYDVVYSFCKLLWSTITINVHMLKNHLTDYHISRKWSNCRIEKCSTQYIFLFLWFFFFIVRTWASSLLSNPNITLKVEWIEIKKYNTDIFVVYLPWK